AVPAGDGAGRDPWSGRECDTAARHQFEQEAGRADRAIGEGCRPAGAGEFAADPAADLPLLEVARSPARDLRADDEAVIVAEIGDDGDRTDLVDRGEGRAGDLDAGMDG